MDAVAEHEAAPAGRRDQGVEPRLRPRDRHPVVALDRDRQVSRTIRSTPFAVPRPSVGTILVSALVRRQYASPVLSEMASCMINSNATKILWGDKRFTTGYQRWSAGAPDGSGTDF